MQAILDDRCVLLPLRTVRPPVLQVTAGHLFLQCSFCMHQLYITYQPMSGFCITSACAQILLMTTSLSDYKAVCLPCVDGAQQQLRGTTTRQHAGRRNGGVSNQAALCC